MPRRAEAVGDLEDARHLDDVAGDADDVGVGVEVDRLAGVLVAERDGELLRGEGGEGEQAQRREDGVVRRQRHEVFQAPVRGRESRCDEVHARTEDGPGRLAACTRVGSRHQAPRSRRAMRDVPN